MSAKTIEMAREQIRVAELFQVNAVLTDALVPLSQNPEVLNERGREKLANCHQFFNGIQEQFDQTPRIVGLRVVEPELVEDFKGALTKLGIMGKIDFQDSPDLTHEQRQSQIRAKLGAYVELLDRMGSGPLDEASARLRQEVRLVVNEMNNSNFGRLHHPTRARQFALAGIPV